MKTSFHFSALVIAGLLAAAALGALTGCASSDTTASSAAVYVRGSLQISFPHTFDQVVAASNRAIDQLGFIKASEKNAARSATIIAGDSDSRKVEIWIESAGENLTRLHIRIAMLGDEEASTVILDQIRKNLG